MADMSREERDEILALAERFDASNEIDFTAPECRTVARSLRFLEAALRLLAGEKGEPAAWRYRYNGKWYTCDTKEFACRGLDATPLYLAPPARSYAEGVEDAAKWHEAEIAQLEQQIIENNEYAERRPEGVGGANAYCRAKITTHRFSIEAIRALAPKEG